MRSIFLDWNFIHLALNFGGVLVSVLDLPACPGRALKSTYFLRIIGFISEATI